jgi:Predicted oxidoreductases of the aldo/keto reductase family
MIYRKNQKNGDELSQLGFGVMRLPADKKGNIDEAESIRILRLARDMGVNYFDTAYIYYNGKSEEILGKAVEPFRKEIKLTSKLPLRGIKTNADFDKLFYTSLKRLNTTYIDYYLIHNIMSIAQYEYIEKLGLADWILEKKAKGEIVNIGFSSHASCADYIKIIDAYDWDFCQMQYNYLDTEFQAGTRGLEYANAKGLPVIIMEPLRGGALVNLLPERAQKLFKADDSERSFADWGLSWVLNHEEVTVVLSGMGSEEMVRDNVEIASKRAAHEIDENGLKVYDEVKRAISGAKHIPCTGCHYCMPCPKGVDIPACFSAYNSKDTVGKFQGIGNYVISCGGLSNTPALASQCVECGACEQKCPQCIPIRQELKKVKRTFEIPLMRPVLKIVKRFGKF